MGTEEKNIRAYLEEMRIGEELIFEVLDFRNTYDTDEAALDHVSKPEVLFYGKEILEMAIAALLHGENILLSGAKATGKMSFARHWHGCLADHPIMFPFM